MLPTYRPDRHDELVWESDLVRFGSFEATPDQPDFSHAGEIRSSPCVVFPRTPVRIVQEGKEPFVSTPRNAAFYNLGQPYRRYAVGEHRDLCDWVHFAPEVVAELLSELDPERADDPEAPYRSPWLTIDAETYALQRLVMRHAVESGAPDPLLVEESLLWVLRQTLAGTVDGRACGELATGRRRAEAARRILAERYAQNLGLATIAAEIGCSVFHLCRIFRAHVGTSLHRYRHELRLSVALERVAERDSDLCAVALDLGFSSHSHFTASFRRTFGVAPSEFRQRASTRRVRELREELCSRGKRSGS